MASSHEEKEFGLKYKLLDNGIIEVFACGIRNFPFTAKIEGLTEDHVFLPSAHMLSYMAGGTILVEKMLVTSKDGELEITGKIVPECEDGLFFEGHFIPRSKVEEDSQIEPEEMPKFLNDVAHEHFKDNEEIRSKLVQCSVYIHGFLMAEKMRKERKA